MKKPARYTETAIGGKTDNWMIHDIELIDAFREGLRGWFADEASAATKGCTTSDMRECLDLYYADLSKKPLEALSRMQEELYFPDDFVDEIAAAREDIENIVWTSASHNARVSKSRRDACLNRWTVAFPEGQRFLKLNCAEREAQAIRQFAKDNHQPTAYAVTMAIRSFLHLK